MMIFSEDKNAARSIPARIASYSISLLDTGSLAVWLVLSFPLLGL